MKNLSIDIEAVVGSRCFGLELPNSDVDIARIADDWVERKHEGRKHYLQGSWQAVPMRHS